MVNNDDPGEPPEPLDYSPSSGATDPEHAAQDQSEEYQVGRHRYTENRTFAEEDIPSVADRPVRWTDVDNLDEEHKRETETGEVVPVSRWKTLNDANRDFCAGDGKRISQEWRNENYKQDIKLWGSQLELTDHEVERSIFLFESTDPQQRRQNGIEAVMLAAITLAANEGRDDRNTSQRVLRPQFDVPDDAPAIAEADVRDRYTEIRDSVNVTTSQVTECRQMIRTNI